MSANQKNISDPGHAQSAPSKNSAIELAWRVHTAQEAWTSKVDTKASILLAIEGGMLFAVASANGKDGLLYELTGWSHFFEIAASSLLLVAITGTVAAIYPRLGSTRDHVAHHKSNYIYFGHLRHWEPAQLEAKLDDIDTDAQLAALAMQLVAMSQINWKKHRCVQVSIALFAVSLLGFVTAIAT